MKLNRLSLSLILLAITPVIRAADRARVTEIGHGIMCLCAGCSSTLSTCPHHLSCEVGVPMRDEIIRYLDQGMTNEDVFRAFAEKYGARVLAAPPVEGAFNIAGWVMPFVVLIVSSLLLAYFVRVWHARSAAAAPVASVDPLYNDRLEKELRNFTPED